MSSIIETLEKQITDRLDEAKRKIAITGDADTELDAALEDIHTYCRTVDDDIKIMMNSCW
ncbi:MAG: hypothetical protein NTZ39_05310 [Methanoregula sp.]|nr:hypothetical protein [Methanoregula sp.]